MSKSAFLAFHEDPRHLNLIIPLAKILRIPIAVNSMLLLQQVKKENLEAVYLPDETMTQLIEKGYHIFLSCYPKKHLQLLFESKTALLKTPFRHIFLQNDPELPMKDLDEDQFFYVFHQNAGEELEESFHKFPLYINIMGDVFAQKASHSFPTIYLKDLSLKEKVLPYVQSFFSGEKMALYTFERHPFAYEIFEKADPLFTDDPDTAQRFLAYKKPLIMLKSYTDPLLQKFPVLIDEIPDHITEEQLNIAETLFPHISPAKFIHKHEAFMDALQLQ